MEDAKENGKDLSEAEYPANATLNPSPSSDVPGLPHHTSEVSQEGHYLQVLERFNDLGLSDSSRKVLKSFFDSLKDSARLFKPEDLVLLDTTCDDLLRIKELQKIIRDEGYFFKRSWTDKFGNEHTSTVPNPAVDMLHRAETQFRNNLKALALTRSEARKSGSKADNPLGEVIDV